MKLELYVCPNCGSRELKQTNITKIDDFEVCSYFCKSCNINCSAESKIPKNLEKKTNIDEFNFNNEIYNANTLFKRTKESIVEIYVCYNDFLGAAGTGFAIGNNYVLTNSHVVLHENQGKYSSFENGTCNFVGDNNSIGIELISANPKKDIALIRVHSDKLKPLKFASKVETGDKVFAIGNAKGQGNSIVDGIISNARVNKDNLSYIMFSAPVNHGNSGGPVLNEKGEIIGMVTCALADANAMNYAIPYDVLIDFINEVEKKECIKVF